MEKQGLSWGAVAAVCLAVVLVLGGLIWWRTAPQAGARAYSDSVAKLEENQEVLNKEVEREEYFRKNPEAHRQWREMYGDKEPQPEVTN